VENNFKTDTAVASQLALLQKGDTDVKLGNLLTLPVGGGLLYVVATWAHPALMGAPQLGFWRMVS